MDRCTNKGQHVVTKNTDAGKALVEALLQHMQIEAEGFAETNRALLCIDDEVTILIAVDADTTRMIAPLGTAPRSAAGLSAVLEENFRTNAGEGYSYSIEPETKDLVMTRTVRAHDVDAEQFIGQFIAMAEYAACWTQALAAGSTEHGASAHATMDKGQRGNNHGAARASVGTHRPGRGGPAPHANWTNQHKRPSRAARHSGRQRTKR